MSKGRSGLVRFGISIVITVVLVRWLLGDLGIGAVVEAIRGAWLPGLALGLVVFWLMIAFRVMRYRALLQERVPLGALTLITVVRGMVADLLPARIGTLVYVWLVTTRAGVPLPDALSSFFLALVLDMIVIAPMLLLALAVVGFGVEAGGMLVALAGILLAVSVVALVLLAPGLRLAGRVLRAQTLTETAGQVVQVHRRGDLIPAVLLSCGVRITKFGAHYLILQSVLVPLGIPWGSLGFFESFLGVAGAELSAMLPVSGLGAFGTWEAAFALGFTQLGLTQDQAVLAGFATHVLTQLHDYGLGTLCLLALMRPRRRLATVR